MQFKCRFISFLHTENIFCLNKSSIRIINPPLSNLVIFLNQESCLNRESIQSIFSHQHHWVHQNLVFRNKKKDIEILYNYIHDMVQKGVVKLQHVPKDDPTADILSKTLLRTKFEYFHRILGVEENLSLVKRESRN